MAELVGLIASVLQLVDTVAKAGTYIKNFSEAPKEQQNLLAEVQNIRPLLEDLKQHIPGWQRSGQVNGVLQLQPALVQLERTIKRLTDKLYPAESSKFSKRVAWALWDRKEAKNDLDDIERFKSLLTGWLGKDVWDATQQREREKLIQWLSPLNFFPRQDDISSIRQEGTGEWLLETSEFKDWISSTGKIIWCHGMPGAGKTVIASMVVNHLHEKFKNQSVGIAYIYCNHREAELQSPSNLLASLWRQFILGRYISGDAHDLYLRHGERHTRPSIDEIMAVLITAIAGYSKIMIIVDALDECPNDKNTRDILLARLGSLGPNVNLLLTSRPHIEVESMFPQALWLEIRASVHDIRRYVQAQISLSSRLAKHIRASPDLRSEIENKVVDHTDGMFLLAKLHMNSLMTKSTVRAVRQTLADLPKDLDHSYDDSMQRIYHQNDDDKHLALRVLSWLSTTMRPLSVSELREALAIEPGTTVLYNDGLPDMDIVLSVCAGLVVVDQTDNIVRLIHYTTQNYLDRIQNKEFPHAHLEIAASCLTYLCLTDFTDLPVILTNFDALRLCEDHPLLAYAAEYGLFHARGKPESVIQDTILKVLAQGPRWLHLLQSLGRWQYDETPPFSASSYYIAALFDLQSITRRLCMHANGEEQNPDGEALYIASLCGHAEIVQLLSEHGVDINARVEGHYVNALEVASAMGHEEIACLLLINGAYVNAQGGAYGTALQAASHKGKSNLVWLLLENGADVNTHGGYYGNALQAATAKGHTEIVWLLIAEGANVNAHGGEYGTALHAASFEGHTDIVNMLLENGAHVNARGGEYCTALQAASRNAYEEIVSTLITHGADVNAQGGEFGTALQAASWRGNASIVSLLINNGAHVNANAAPFGTALQAASAAGQISVVQLLLSSGADVAARGGRHGSAYRAALKEGHEAVVELLMSKWTHGHDGLSGGFGEDPSSWEGNDSSSFQLISPGKKF